MAITIECRAIHLSTEFPDLIVTTSHLPDSQDEGVAERLLSTALDIPSWAIVRRQDLSSFWNALPNHIQTGFPPSSRDWLEEDARFVNRVLELQLEGDFSSPTPLGIQAGPWPQVYSDPVSRLLDWYYSDKRLGNPPQLQRWGARDSYLYGVFLARLHGVYIGQEEASRVSEAISEISVQELPLSHSPGLEGVTLKDLMNKGVKSACFFPLLAGVYGGVQNLLAGSLVLAWQVTGIGAGMTLCAISTLWLADRIFGAIKHID